MKTLLLLRHGKSAWGRPRLEDFDRPLSPRGQQAAPVMANFILERKLAPDLVLCSTARRAREEKARRFPDRAATQVEKI